MCMCKCGRERGCLSVCVCVWVWVTVSVVCLSARHTLTQKWGRRRGHDGGDEKADPTKQKNENLGYER